MPYTFTFGGIDWTQAPAAPMAAAEFTQQFPQLPTTVQQSIETKAKDPQDETSWAGGRTVLQPTPPEAPLGQQPSGLAQTGTPKWIWLSGLLLCVGGVLLVILARRRRRLPLS